VDIKQQDEKYEVGSAFYTNREETDADTLVEITRAKTGPNCKKVLNSCLKCNKLNPVM